MIRVLQVGLGPNPGGIENCIMNYYRHIDREKFQFDFADIYGEGLAFEEEISGLGGKIWKFLRFKKHPFLFLKEFSRVLESESYDLIHINLLSAANILPVLIAHKKKKGKVIVHCHNSGIPAGTLRRLLHHVNRPILRKIAEYKWACGQNAGNWMWGDRFPSKDIVCNAIDREKYSRNDHDRELLRKQLNIQENETLLGFVGRLEEQKNPLFLLEILKELSVVGSKYKLLLLGDGSFRAEMQNRAKDLFLEEKVIFLGIQKEVAQWYSAMDFFLLPSFFEGLPVVAIEAQAGGLPCFLSDSITKETDISGNITFLSIRQGGKVWAEAIREADTKKTVENMDFPEEYDIFYAVRNLEEKYMELM